MRRLRTRRPFFVVLGLRSAHLHHLGGSLCLGLSLLVCLKIDLFPLLWCLLGLDLCRVFNLHNLVIASKLSLKLIVDDSFKGGLLWYLFFLHRSCAHLAVKPLELNHLLLVSLAIVSSTVEVNLFFLFAEFFPFLSDELGQF